MTSRFNIAFTYFSSGCLAASLLSACGAKQPETTIFNTQSSKLQFDIIDADFSSFNSLESVSAAIYARENFISSSEIVRSIFIRELEHPFDSQANKNQKDILALRSDLKEVTQILLNEPQQIDQIVEACSSEELSIKRYRTPTLSNVIPTLRQEYLLHLDCHSNSSLSSSLFLHFSNPEGLQIEPVELTQLTISRSGEVLERKYTDMSAFSTLEFNIIKREDNERQLLLTLRNDQQWDYYTMSRYSFNKETILLEEYLTGKKSTVVANSPYRIQYFVREEDEWVFTAVRECNSAVKLDKTNELDFSSCRDRSEITLDATE